LNTVLILKLIIPYLSIKVKQFVFKPSPNVVAFPIPIFKNRNEESDGKKNKISILAEGGYQSPGISGHDSPLGNQI
jgi:hypothetical protein